MIVEMKRTNAFFFIVVEVGYAIAGWRKNTSEKRRSPINLTYLLPLPGSSNLTAMLKRKPQKEGRKEMKREVRDLGIRIRPAVREPGPVAVSRVFSSIRLSPKTKITK